MPTTSIPNDEINNVLEAQGTTRDAVVRSFVLREVQGVVTAIRELSLLLKREWITSLEIAQYTDPNNPDNDDPVLHKSLFLLDRADELGLVEVRANEVLCRYRVK